MPRPVRGLELDSDQRRELESLVERPPPRSGRAARPDCAGLCRRAFAGGGCPPGGGARRRIVTKWCGRFRKLGLAGLTDSGGRGRKPSLPGRPPGADSHPGHPAAQRQAPAQRAFHGPDGQRVGRYGAPPSGKPTTLNRIGRAPSNSPTTRNLRPSSGT